MQSSVEPSRAAARGNSTARMKQPYMPSPYGYSHHDSYSIDLDRSNTCFTFSSGVPTSTP